MYTNPSAARVIQCIQESLDREVMPELASDKAKVTLAMIQSMLTSVAKRIAVEQQHMADECNRMTAVMRDIAQTLAGSSSEAAEAYRRLASAHATQDPYPIIPASDELNARYREVSDAFTEGIGHLHTLTAEGVERADQLLRRARACVQLRIERDMAVFAMEGGMIGRG